MYRSENSKLNHVLDVVNFLGRSDSVSMLRVEKGAGAEFNTQHVFDDPSPIWKRLGDDFHGYSSHWHKNEYNAGGEVVTIAVGLQRSVVKFRCSFIFPDSATLITGLFSYARVEMASSMSKDTEHYHVYKFLCKVNKDFAVGKGPRVVVFHDIQSGSADHFMHVNHLSTGPTDKNKNGKSQPVATKSSVAACVDFIPYNITKIAASQSNLFSDKEILKFFLHHAIVGIQDFIVYEMNTFPTHTHDLLANKGIRISKLPFNFPYELGDALKIRGILEMDCLLRTSAHIKFVLLTRINEYFMPTCNVRLNRTFVQSLEVHPENINRFELPLQTICVPETDAGDAVRGDFNFYDSNARSDHPVFVYRPTYKLLDTVKSIELGQGSGLVHRYSRHCSASATLMDWRQAVTPEHLHFIAEVQSELRGLLV